MKHPDLFAVGLICLLAGLSSASVRAQSSQAGSASGNLQNRMQKAAGLLQRGEIDGAEVELEAILAAAPRYGPANLLLGQIRLERGELEAARENLAVATSSNVRRPHLAWHLLGRVQLEMGEPELATDSFGKALELAPQLGPALLGRSRAAIRLGDVDSAVADLELARSLQGAGSEPALLLAEILLTRGSIVEALEVLRPLAEQSPGSEGSLEARLLTLSVGGEEELPALYRLVGENLHLARAYLALGLARHRTSGGRAATLPLRIALEIEDQDPVPWLMLREVTPEEDSTGYPEPLPDLRGRLEHARRLFDVGDTGGGQEIVGAILDQRPHHVPAHLVPVLDAEAREDPWVALAGYRRLADWLPEIPSLQARAARIAHTMEAEELATCLARRAMQSMPEEPSLHYLLAAIHSEAGEWEAASTACRRAIELGMEEAPLYLTLGRVEFEQMHIGESIDAYAKAVELDPDADRAVPRFALATLSTEEFDALRDLMEIELQRDPKGENTLYTLGLMSLRDNDFAAAVEYFERLSSLLPEDTQVQHHLGTAYMRAGDKEKGKAALERFRELKAAEEEAWVEHNQAYAKKLQAQDATAAGERDEALRIYNELASAGFAEPDDYLAAGALYLEAEDYERAYGWFEQFLNANPYKREALEGLAEAAAGLGSTEVAIEARARADLLSWPCTVDP